MIRSITLTAAVAQIAAVPTPAKRTGAWIGTLTLPSQATLRVAVHLRRDGDGPLSGTFDSIDQRIGGIPLAAITITETTFDFTVPTNGGQYRGRWDVLSRRWVGTWSQGKANLPLALTASERSPMPALVSGAWALPSDAEIGDLLDRRLAQRPGEAIVVGMIDETGRRIIVRGPARADTLFEIGSITKVFTGLLLADMAVSGEVGLNDAASRYLPAGWTLPSRGRPITLLDLATHRSGLPRQPLNMPFADAGNPYADYGPVLMRDFLSAYTPTSEPGTAFEYSNLGAGLLGRILAERAGRDYETLLRTRILAPLHMRDTWVRLPASEAPRLAAPLDEYLRPTSNWDMGAMAAAGGIRSNVDDLLMFLAANIAPSVTSLGTAMRDARMIRAGGDAADMSMGIGWMIARTRIGDVVMHDGATGGYLTMIGFDPVRRRGVVILSNATVQPGVTDIGLHILTGSPVAATPPPPSAPIKQTEIAASAEQLDKFIGRYQLAPDQVLTVTRPGQHLVIQLTGQQAVPIYAAGPQDFFAKVVEARFSFHMTGNAADSVTLHQDGQESVAPRITAP